MVEFTITDLCFIHDELHKLKITYYEKIEDLSSENFNQSNDELDYINQLYSKVGKILEKKLSEPTSELDEFE